MAFGLENILFGGGDNVLDFFAGSGVQGRNFGDQSLFRQGINDVNRRFDVTQGNINPFIQAGQGQLDSLTQGASIGGFGDRLRELMTGGALDPLIESRTRAAQGQLAAGGLTRSGTALQEISAIPQNLFLQIENLLTGRSQGLANQGQSAALGLGGLSGQAAGQTADLFSGEAGRQQQERIAREQQATARRGQNLDFVSNFFSDPKLKENIVKIGEAGPLNLYEWDWKPETKDTIISKSPTTGFLADEVKEKFPQFVSEVCGFLTIDYFGLLKHLETDVLEGACHA